MVGELQKGEIESVFMAEKDEFKKKKKEAMPVQNLEKKDKEWFVNNGEIWNSETSGAFTKRLVSFNSV